MLKSCWQCIAGERLDEMVPTTNDNSQKVGLQDNEIIFQLPRDLIKICGRIVINGKLSQNRKRLRIGFMSGKINSVKTPLYYIIFNYVSTEIIVERNENGIMVVIPQGKFPNLNIGSDFKLNIQFKNKDQGIYMGAMFEAFGFNDGLLLTETDLQSPQNFFLSINDDTLEISQLDFIWA